MPFILAHEDLLAYIGVMESAAAKVMTSIMLKPDLRARLDDFAAAMDRSRSWLAAKAIEAFLETPSPLAEPSSATPRAEPPPPASGRDRRESAASKVSEGRPPMPPAGNLVAGTLSCKDDFMDTPDPVAATRLLQAQHVDRTLRHEAAKRQSTAKAQDAACDKTGEYLKGKG
jgi:hypothetical protein